jgi:hypothetical protein
VRRTEYVDASHLAIFGAALGRPKEAVAELERALAENSAWLYAMRVDPKLDILRDDARFRRLLRNQEPS